jgi:hypothetical protein
MSITITVPNDDHVALRAMAKALEEIAVARGALPRTQTRGAIDYTLNIDTTRATAALKELVEQAEVDTTSQQVESLSHGVVNREVYFDNPAPQVSHATTDSTGTPWDERIHSASKALNSDGTWRLRRKPKDMTDDEWTMYVNDVKVEICESQRESEDSEEFKQLLKECEEEAPKILEAMSQVFEPSVTPSGDDFHVDAGEVTEQQIVSIPVPPLPAVPQVEEKTAPDGHEYAHMTFPQVMQFLTERHGRITSAQVDDIIADMGLNSIMDLNTQPEHTGPFIARVKALLGE